MAMIAIEPNPADRAAHDVSEDRFFVINGVSWEQYEAICAAFEDQAGLRMTYCEGTLELMSPGPTHESEKKTLARLIEAYADEMGIALNGYGSTTFRKRARKRGLEPDECYIIGKITRADEVPALAVEVVVTGGLLDKLDVYAGLGVPELWRWKDGQLCIFWLGPNGYEPMSRSRLLPDLDITELVQFIKPEDQAGAVRAYRARLREKAKDRPAS